MMIDGKKLREIRRRLDMSQADFGQMTGYRSEHISRLEKGKHPIPPIVQVFAYVINRSPNAYQLARQVAGLEYALHPDASPETTREGER
jgi:transcriptional regulator with XRE-family HTH domain